MTRRVHRARRRLLLGLSLFLCAMVSSLVYPQAGLDSAKRLTQYAFDRWDQETDLPSVHIYDLAQTDDGYLWLGTSDGLVRFDGIRFTTWDSTNTASLTSDDVFALHLGSQGRLWVGTGDGGLLLRDGGTLRRVLQPYPRSENGIMAIFEDRAGYLWLWRDLAGPRRYRTVDAELVDTELPARLAEVAFPPQQIPRRSIHQDRSGTLWFASHGSGLFGLGRDSLQVLTTADGLRDDFVHAVVEDSDGGLWIGTNEGLHRYREGQLTDETGALGLGASPGAVHALHVDASGTLWVARRDVFRRAGGGLETLPGEAHFGGETRFLEDREGSLWIGQIGGGLVRLRDDAATPIGPPEGLPDDVVLTVFEDRAGRLWIGTSNKGLMRLEGATITRYTTADGLPHDRIWSIHESSTRDGEMWLGTDGGLVRWTEGGSSGPALRVFTRADGLSNDRVRIVHEDPAEPGTLWLGTIDGGLNRFARGAFSSWTRADGLAHDNVRWLHKDRGGNLWIGLQNGLNRLSPWGDQGGETPRDGRLESFGKEDGLLSTRVRVIYEDAEGTIWIGSSGGGLSRFTDGRFVSYSKKHGLRTEDVWGVLEEDDGTFWLSGPRVVRVAKEDFAALDTGRIPLLGAEDMGSAALQRTDCCNAGGFPSAWKGHDGRLWFPGVHGVVVVEPRRLRDRTELPPTLIESVAVDGLAATSPAELDVAPGNHHLEIRYTCPSLAAADRLSFRYRLAGIDQEWIEPGTRRVAYYSHLPAGRYRFEVTARDGMGPWGPSAGIPVTLRPFWWQMIWFRGTVLLALAGLAVALYRGRKRSLQEKYSALDQLAHVGRVAMMGELTAAFAHELNQPLTAIGTNARTAKRFMAEPDPDLDEVGEILDDIDADNRRAAEVIRRLRDLMQKHELQVELLDVNSVIEDVVELLNSEAVFHDVSLELRLDRALAPILADRIHLQQVLMNLISNAFEAMRHSPPSDRRLVIRTQRGDEETVLVSLRDFGTGFDGRDPEELFAPFHSTKDQGMGMGLSISKSIVESHGGRISAVESPGGGATFQLRLPLSPPTQS